MSKGVARQSIARPCIRRINNSKTDGSGSAVGESLSGVLLQCATPLWDRGYAGRALQPEHCSKIGEDEASSFSRA